MTASKGAAWMSGVGLLTILAAHALAGPHVFRCESQGKVTYSDVACGGEAEEVEVDRGLNSFTANEPTGQDSKNTPSKRKAARTSHSSSIAEEQARHKQHCSDIQKRIDAITTQLWSDSSLRKRSNRSEKLRERQAKLETERHAAKCH